MVEKEKLSLKELKHNARRKSIKEGIFARAKTSLGFNYISPFAIAINTSSSLVALLSSITGLLGSLSELAGSKLMHKYSRKDLVVKTVFLEIFLWIPFILIAYLYSQNILTSLLPYLLLTVFSFYTISAHLHTPAWFSWMGDIVDKEYRGRWFSKRNLILGFVAIVLTILAAVFLDFFKKREMLMLGFMILFGLALISRTVSWISLKKQYEPKLKLKKEDYFSFSEFIKKAPKNNFGKLAIFRGFFSFAVAISSSLMAIYLLRYLEFSYSVYMLIILSGTFFSLLTLGLWGKLSDKYGNYRILCITSILIPLSPLLWIIHSSPIYLIFVPSLIGGVSWAGFHLAEKNFIYDNVSQQKRGFARSYYDVLWGMGVFLGAGIGALLIKYLTINSIEPLFLIFIIGAIARMIVSFISIKNIKEIRKMKKCSPKELKNIVFKEAKPTLLEEAHDIISIKDYLKE